MKKTITTLILLLTISAQSFACECLGYSLADLDKESSEWSEIILIGNIVKTGDNFKVEVNEVLKGEITSCEIEGLTIGKNEVFNNCTFYPREKGEYLLYLRTIKIDGKNYYYSSQCLGSRLLNLTYGPVSLNEKKSKAQLIEETKQWIDQLRSRRK